MGKTKLSIGKRTRFAVAVLGVTALVVGLFSNPVASLAFSPHGNSLEQEHAGPGEADVPGHAPPSEETLSGVADGFEGADRDAGASLGHAGSGEEAPPEPDENALSRAEGGSAKPVVSVAIEAIGETTNGSAALFEYLIEFTCLSRLADCEDVVIDVPFTQTTPVATSATPIALWNGQLISADESLIASGGGWENGTDVRQIPLRRTLEAGHSGSVRIKLYPDSGRVANGTSWRVQPTISASNADPSESPTAVSNTATASSVVNVPFSLLESSTVPVGAKFAVLSGQQVFADPAHPMGSLYADETQPHELVIALPEGVNYISVSQDPELVVFDPVTRELTVQTSGGTLRTIVFSLDSTVPVGTELALEATGTVTLIGEASPRSTSATINILAWNNDLNGNVLGAMVVGNSITTGTSATHAVPATESSETVNMLARVKGQHRDTRFSLAIDLPCFSPRTGSPGSWLPTAGCDEPLVNAQSVSAVFPEGVTEPLAVTVTLTDGTTHEIAVGTEPVSLTQWAGSVIQASVSDVFMATAEPGAVWGEEEHYELSVNVAIEDRPEVADRDTIGMHADLTVAAADDPAEAIRGGQDRSTEFRRGLLAAPIMRMSGANGWTWGDSGATIHSGAQWIGPVGPQLEKATTALLLPAGLAFTPDGWFGAVVEEIPNFGGGDRTLVRFLLEDPTSLGSLVNVDSRSLEPGIYEYEIFHGYRGYATSSCEAGFGEVVEQELVHNLADVFVDGQSDSACWSTQKIVVRGSQNAQSITKEVRGDLDTQWQGAPGTTNASPDGSGTAEYRLSWANIGPTALHNVVIYDALPTPGDTGSVGALAGVSRGSDFPVRYTSVVAPAGYAVAYSESTNPCRPELGVDTTGACVDDWEGTPQGSLADVRALRFSAADPAKSRRVDEMIISVALPSFEGGEAALNTAAAGAQLASGRAIPAVESPMVGVGNELRAADIWAGKEADVESGEPVRPGDTVTYTVSLRNDGGSPGEFAYADALTGILDDAVLLARPSVAGDGNVTAEILDDQLEIRGALRPGEAATVTYSVKVGQAVDRGDSVLLNFLVEDGEAAPETCSPESDVCTEHPIEDLVLLKRATPESGEGLVAGDTVDYELELLNQGAAEVSVDAVDQLADVLDDAEVVGDPSTSTPEIIADFDGAQLRVSGTLAAGDRVTVNYSVRVVEPSDGTNYRLRNWLLPRGVPVPETCAADVGNCTDHPIGAVRFVKSADPVSGTSVGAGDTVTYTVDLSNPGGTPATVELRDLLADVLDDAEFVGAPKIDGTGVVASLADGVLSISGSLPGGGQAAVSYTVRVRADTPAGHPQRSLVNFIHSAGTEVPDTCVESAHTCTTHPVAEAVSPKPPAVIDPEIPPLQVIPPGGPGLVAEGGTQPAHALLFAALGTVLLGLGLLRGRRSPRFVHGKR